MIGIIKSYVATTDDNKEDEGADDWDQSWQNHTGG